MSPALHNAAAEAGDRARLDRVVVGVDFSAPALAAVQWVRDHFAPQAECVLIHALDVPRPPRFLRRAYFAYDDVLASAREGAAARIERLLKAHEWSGVVTAEVRDGRPEDVIATAARERAADLVVVGEHARPRGMWGTLGSTAEALVRCSPVPVLLARSVPDHPPQHILVAVDESGHSAGALRWAHLLAQRFNAAVSVFHVFRPVYLSAAQSVSGMAASLDLELEQLEQTQEWLDRQVHAAGFGPGEAVTRIVAGEPASALVAAQRGGRFDLVIMGSRGAGGAARMLLGSVANGVLRGASCPVLVVHGAADE
jgi:nucleotide-binding universal stress UspA family protein